MRLNSGLLGRERLSSALWQTGVCAAAIAIAAIVGTPASAQSDSMTPASFVGSDVRVRFESDSTVDEVRGVLREVSDGSLIVDGPDERQYQIRQSVIESVEVRMGQSHGKGAMRGLTFGALGGALAYGIYLLTSPSGQGGAGPPREFAFVLGGVAGGVLGLLVGAAIGVEQWEVVR